MTYEEILKKYGLEAYQLDGFYRREVVQLSQSELSDLTGIKQPVISAYESGRERRPSTHEAYKEIGVELWVEVMAQVPGRMDAVYGIVAHGDVLAIHRSFPDRVPVREEWLDGQETTA